MQTLRCIAVDDEPLALNVIRTLAAKVPFIDLMATFTDPLAAMAFLRAQPVDVLFLDIQMPDLSGIQFLESLSARPLVIFTTAHSQYAIESYSLDAVDYLLKPVPFNRFLKAVNKAYRSMYPAAPEAPTAATPEAPTAPHAEEKEFLFVKSDTRIFKVNLHDIRYIEGMRDYICLHVAGAGAGQKIMSLMPMSRIIGRLPERDFRRVHKSYIVNVRHISLIQGNRICIGDKEIPISNTYRDDFYAAIGEGGD